MTLDVLVEGAVDCLGAQVNALFLRGLQILERVRLERVMLHRGKGAMATVEF